MAELTARFVNNIKDKNARRIVKAMIRYGTIGLRTNGAHIIVKCPLGSTTMSLKNNHFDKQMADLERLGVDMVRFKELLD